MAPSQSKKRLTLKSIKSNRNNKNSGGGGAEARTSQSAAEEASSVAMKLLRSTGKAAWIAATSFLILVVPLIIQLERDQQLTDIELQQASLLGSPAAAAPSL